MTFSRMSKTTKLKLLDSLLQEVCIKTVIIKIVYNNQAKIAWFTSARGVYQNNYDRSR